MTNKLPFVGILFDVDGTLIDTIPFIVETFQYVFAQYQITGVSEEHILASIGVPLESYLSQFKQAETSTLIDTYIRFNKRGLDHATAIFLGIPEMLTDLRALGMPISVVTSKRHASALHTLAVFGLENSFDRVFAKEDTLQHKPHPAPLQFAMRQLGYEDPSRVLYVGDSIHDIQSAKAAGCPACAVGWSRMPLHELKAAQPLYWVDKPHQIVELAKGGRL
jgi:pyrophosphatase PpaX